MIITQQPRFCLPFREKSVLLQTKTEVCMWYKYGLKAQKLLAQGNALGIIAVSKAPCKGKSLICCLIL